MQKFNHLATETDLIAFYNSGARDNMMHGLGIGTMRRMKSVIKDIFLPVWTSRAYTLSEKYNIWNSKMMFLPKTNLKTETLSTDFFGAYPQIDIPIYFICGKYVISNFAYPNFCNKKVPLNSIKNLHLRGDKTP